MNAAPPIVLKRRYVGLDTPSPVATAITVEEMCRHIESAQADPLVVQTAQSICAPAVDELDCLSRLWWYVKSHVQFVSDDSLIRQRTGERDQLELLTSPSVLLREKQPQGDCDCFTMAVLALARALGFECRIVTICADRTDPGRYSHVCGECKLSSGAWMTLDASHGTGPGWEIPAHDQFRRTAWDMRGRMVSDRDSKKKARAA